MFTKIFNFIGKNAIYIIMVQVAVAICGSLYFSDIKGYTPCVLCWYQRIFMYSQLPIIIIATLRKETKIYQYTIPMSLLGMAVAIYHNFLYTGIIKDPGLCTTGISCTTKFVQYLGFVTIPFLSITAFSIIIFLSIINRNYIKHHANLTK